MSADDDRRRELECLGFTGRTNPELDQLNRAKTDGMTDAQLFDRLIAHPEKCVQAREALRRRGHVVK